MEYPIELLQEQVELLSDEYILSEGEERKESLKRLDECHKALQVLKNY